MSKRIRVVQFGCGPIGCSVAETALQRSEIEIVGAIDIDKNKAGRDLGEVMGIERALGIIISDDVDAVFAKANADVAFHQTSSSFERVYPELIKLLRFGVNIVSTTEELSYPYKKYPELAINIDKAAKLSNATVLATGVNPGFTMDVWPLAMTAVCRAIRRIKVVRIQDAKGRRLPFQKKIGAGSNLEEFHKLVDDKIIRHVGLQESVDMIAAGLGWQLEDVTESIEPMVAKDRLQSQYITVKPGCIAGVRQVSRGFLKGEEVITLEFEASLGAKKSYDAVYITGTPNLEVVVAGGIPGDVATAAMVVNSVRRVVDAPPGLVTMKDLPLVVCTATNPGGR